MKSVDKVDKKNTSGDPVRKRKTSSKTTPPPKRDRKKKSKDETTSGTGHVRHYMDAFDNRGEIESIINEVVSSPTVPTKTIQQLAPNSAMFGILESRRDIWGYRPQTPGENRPQFWNNDSINLLQPLNLDVENFSQNLGKSDALLSSSKVNNSVSCISINSDESSAGCIADILRNNRNVLEEIFDPCDMVIGNDYRSLVEDLFDETPEEDDESDRGFNEELIENSFPDKPEDLSYNSATKELRRFESEIVQDFSTSQKMSEKSCFLQKEIINKEKSKENGLMKDPRRVSAKSKAAVEQPKSNIIKILSDTNKPKSKCRLTSIFDIPERRLNLITATPRAVSNKERFVLNSRADPVISKNKSNVIKEKLPETSCRVVLERLTCSQIEDQNKTASVHNKKDIITSSGSVEKPILMPHNLGQDNLEVLNIESSKAVPVVKSVVIQQERKISEIESSKTTVENPAVIQQNLRQDGVRAPVTNKPPMEKPVLMSQDLNRDKENAVQNGAEVNKASVKESEPTPKDFIHGNECRPSVIKFVPKSQDLKQRNEKHIEIDRTPVKQCAKTPEDLKQGNKELIEAGIQLMEKFVPIPQNLKQLNEKHIEIDKTPVKQSVPVPDDVEEENKNLVEEDRPLTEKFVPNPLDLKQRNEKHIQIDKTPVKPVKQCVLRPEDLEKCNKELIEAGSSLMENFVSNPLDLKECNQKLNEFDKLPEQKSDNLPKDLSLSNETVRPPLKNFVAIPKNLPQCNERLIQIDRPPVEKFVPISKNFAQCNEKLIGFNRPSVEKCIPIPQDLSFCRVNEIGKAKLQVECGSMPLDLSCPSAKRNQAQIPITSERTKKAVIKVFKAHNNKTNTAVPCNTVLEPPKQNIPRDFQFSRDADVYHATCGYDIGEMPQNANLLSILQDLGPPDYNLLNQQYQQQQSVRHKKYTCRLKPLDGDTSSEYVQRPMPYNTSSETDPRPINRPLMFSMEDRYLNENSPFGAFNDEWFIGPQPGAAAQSTLKARLVPTCRGNAAANNNTKSTDKSDSNHSLTNDLINEILDLSADMATTKKGKPRKRKLAKEGAEKKKRKEKDPNKPKEKKERKKREPKIKPVKPPADESVEGQNKTRKRCREKYAKRKQLRLTQEENKVYQQLIIEIMRRFVKILPDTERPAEMSREVNREKKKKIKQKGKKSETPEKLEENEIIEVKPCNSWLEPFRPPLVIAEPVTDGVRPKHKFHWWCIICKKEFLFFEFFLNHIKKHCADRCPLCFQQFLENPDQERDWRPPHKHFCSVAGFCECCGMTCCYQMKKFLDPWLIHDTKKGKNSDNQENSENQDFKQATELSLCKKCWYGCNVEALSMKKNKYEYDCACVSSKTAGRDVRTLYISTYICRGCNRKFEQSEDLLQHVVEEHELENCQKYMDCSKMAVGKSYWLPSVLEKAPREYEFSDQIFHCTTCSRLFGNLRSLKTHKDMYHRSADQESNMADRPVSPESDESSTSINDKIDVENLTETE